MTEQARVSDIATTFVEALAARGIGLRVGRGRKLEVVPKSAYKRLSADERATLKQHRAAIIAVVRAGSPVLADATPAGEASVPTLDPAPTCPHCYKTPCIGEAHEHFAVLHPLTERQAVERNVDQLLKSVNDKLIRLRYGGTEPTWDTPSTATTAVYLAELLRRRSRGDER